MARVRVPQRPSVRVHSAQSLVGRSRRRYTSPYSAAKLGLRVCNRTATKPTSIMPPMVIRSLASWAGASLTSSGTAIANAAASSRDGAVLAARSNTW